MKDPNKTKQRQMLLLADSVKKNVSQAFLEKQKLKFIKTLIADDGDHNPDDKLSVMNDGSAIQTLLALFKEYVSEDSFENFVPFLKYFDKGLYKFRGNRGLTREDRLANEEEIEQEKAAKKAKRSKKKLTSKPTSDNMTNDNSASTEMAASDLDERMGEFFTQTLRKAG